MYFSVFSHWCYKAQQRCALTENVRLMYFSNIHDRCNLKIYIYNDHTFSHKTLFTLFEKCMLYSFPFSLHDEKLFSTALVAVLNFSYITFKA